MAGTAPFIRGAVGELRVCMKGFSGIVYATREESALSQARALYCIQFAVLRSVAAPLTPLEAGGTGVR